MNNAQNPCQIIPNHLKVRVILFLYKLEEFGLYVAHPYYIERLKTYLTWLDFQGTIRLTIKIKLSLFIEQKSLKTNFQLHVR